MTQHEAYELGYDKGMVSSIDHVPSLPQHMELEFENSYLRGYHHAIEDRIS